MRERRDSEAQVRETERLREIPQGVCSAMQETERECLMLLRERVLWFRNEKRGLKHNQAAQI